jgi:hypothetical protein
LELELESEQQTRPGGVPRSDSLRVGEDVMDDSEDKSELLDQVGIEGSGIAADIVIGCELAAGRVMGWELMSVGVIGHGLAVGGVIGRELEWVLLAVSLFDNMLSAGCPHVERHVNTVAIDI